MKNIYVLGNWKSNKTLSDAKKWIETYSKNVKVPIDVTVIICPASLQISLFQKDVVSAHVGLQNVSAFETGAYTGEIAASMMTGIVEYVMIGHSERRKNFGESDEIVAQKTMNAILAGIKPVVCVSNLDQVKSLQRLVLNFLQTGLILYEPLFAIGSGQADTPESANVAAKEIISVLGAVPVLYGGSVMPDNVGGFTSQEYISGVGVGGASLDPEKFIAVILSASHAI